MAGKEFSYEIVKQVAVLSKSPKGWTKEVNVISWNGGTPKYDIRDWTPDHSKMGKSEKQEYISQKIKVKDNREKE